MVPSRESFLELLEKQFANVKSGELTFGTKLKSLSEWTSMQSLIVLTEFNENYGITLNVDKYRSVQTIEDMYALVCETLNTND